MIGKYISGGADLVGNEFARDSRREGIRAQQKGVRDAKLIGDEYYDQLQSDYGKDASTYDQDLAAWRELSQQPLLELGKFDDTLDIKGMLDPAVAYRQKQEADIISQSAANAGGTFTGSGATAKALQDRSQEIASDEWGKAYGRADSSMKGKYGRFTDKFAADRANEQTRFNNARGLFDNSTAGRNNLFAARGGQADLGMTSVKQEAGLEADYKNMQAEYYKGQAGVAGGMVGSAIDDGMAAYGAPSGIKDPYAGVKRNQGNI